MKKVLAIIAIVMLVPFTAFGMQMMADTALEDVTGQAGVSISIDNVQMDFQMGYLGWGDSDGIDLPDSGGNISALDADITGIEAGGWVYMSQMQFLNIVIDKYMVGAANISPLNPNLYDGTGDGSLSTFGPGDLSPLTIDVGTIYTAFTTQAYPLYVDSDGDYHYNAEDADGNPYTAVVDGNGDPVTNDEIVPDTTQIATGVRIGVPTLSIYVGTIKPFDISLVAYDDTQASGIATPTVKDTLGSVAMGSIQLDTKGGSITIFAH